MPGLELNSITEKVIGCAYRVSNNLGIGFVEKVYENALAHEIQKSGLRVAQMINFGTTKVQIKRLRRSVNWKTPVL